MRDIRHSHIEPGTRFFLSWGTKEAFGNKNPEIDDRHSRTYRWNKRAGDAIAAKGAEVSYYCQVGGEHCEASWEQQIPFFMDTLLYELD